VGVVLAWSYLDRVGFGYEQVVWQWEDTYPASYAIWTPEPGCIAATRGVEVIDSPMTENNPPPPAFAGFAMTTDWRDVDMHWGVPRVYCQAPCWFLFLLTAILPARWAAIGASVAKRRASGLCPACGYDLRASPDRCPECGAGRNHAGRGRRQG
jgi:hypothetical protein